MELQTPRGYITRNEATISFHNKERKLLNAEVMAYRTLLIEDQRLFRSLLAMYLTQPDFELVGQASDGDTGWELYQEFQPDLVLLDIVIPKINGLQLAERMVQSTPKPNILVITSQTDSFTTNRIFEIGCQGYVEKDQPIEILQEAINTVADGGLYFTQLLHDNRYKMFSEPNAIHKIMSEREKEIIGNIALGRSNPEIAQLLGLSLRTIENHRYRIMKKLNFKTARELMKFALELGLDKHGGSVG